MTLFSTISANVPSQVPPRALELMYDTDFLSHRLAMGANPCCFEGFFFFLAQLDSTRPDDESLSSRWPRKVASLGDDDSAALALIRFDAASLKNFLRACKGVSERGKEVWGVGRAV